MRMSIGKRIFLYVMSVVLAIWLIGPILWIVDASFQLDNELFSVPPHWIPHNPTLANWQYIITRVAPPAYEFTADAATGLRVSGEALAAIPALKNSFIVSTATMFLNVIISILAAYAFSRLKFTGRNTSFSFIMLSRLIPAIAVAIPFFAIIHTAHECDYGKCGSESLHLASSEHGWVRFTDSSSAQGTRSVNPADPLFLPLEHQGQVDSEYFPCRRRSDSGSGRRRGRIRWR